MTTQLSDQDGQKFGATAQTEGQTLAPPNGQTGPEETEASGSNPSCSNLPFHSEEASYLDQRWRRYTTTSYTLQALVVKDMLCDGKSGLTEAIVMGPGWVILFYGRQLLGEGLSLGEAWNAMFILSAAISWVGKQAQLNTNALSLWEGRQMIAQAITKWCIKARGPGCHHSFLPASQPFRFHSLDGPPQEERLQSTKKGMEESRHTHWVLHHDCASWHGHIHGQRWQDCGWHQPEPFYLHQTMVLRVSTSSLVSSCSSRSGDSRHMHNSQCHQEPRGHMEINLPV